MAKQTFTTGQVLTAAQMTSLQETALGGGPATAKTASYVLVAADAGTTVAMNAAGATTITVNTGLFAAGDTVFIQNLGAGACTITAGTATVATAGSLILPQNDAGILYFTSASASVFYDYVQPGITSPVTTKGDLYSFTTTDARLPVGNDGESIVADSSTSTGLAYREDYAAGKNKIINGDFNINQRGFSTTTSNGTFIADRFTCQGSGGTVTTSRQTFTLGAAPIAGYEGTTFIRQITASQSASSNFAQIRHQIESVRTLAGQTVTFSFFAKADSGTPQVAFNYLQNFGTGGSPSSSVNSSGTKVTLSTSFARYSVTVTLASISGKTLGTNNDDYLRLNIWTSAGADHNANTDTLGLQNNTFEIWGWQIEDGSVATAFNTATGTLAGELAACQRYYYRTGTNDSAAFGILTATGWADDTTSTIAILPLPVTMRVAPTAVDFPTIGTIRTYGYGGAQALTALTLGSHTSANFAYLDGTNTGTITAGAVQYLQKNNSATAYIGVTAEL